MQILRPWSHVGGAQESWEAAACAGWTLQVCVMESECQRQSCVQCDWNQQDLQHQVDAGGNVVGMKKILMEWLQH